MSSPVKKLPFSNVPGEFVAIPATCAVLAAFAFAGMILDSWPRSPEFHLLEAFARNAGTVQMNGFTYGLRYERPLDQPCTTIYAHHKRLDNTYAETPSFVTRKCE